MPLYSDDLGVKLFKTEFDDSKLEQLKAKLPKDFIISIFGFAGAGKGTLSTHLSQVLNIANIDSGRIWRALTYGYLQTGLEGSPEATVEIFSRINMRITEDKQTEVAFDGKWLALEQLRRPEVDARVPHLAKIDFNREQYYKFLADFLTNLHQPCILDGRGATPPHIQKAEANGVQIIRFFLDASDDVKAARYYRAWLSKQKASDANFQETDTQKQQILEEFRQTIIERNQRDWQTWIELNMGTITPDTAVMDTSNMTIEEENQTALAHILNRLG